MATGLNHIVDELDTQSEKYEERQLVGELTVRTYLAFAGMLIRLETLSRSSRTYSS